MSPFSVHQAHIYRWGSIALLTCGIVLGSVVGLHALADVIHSYTVTQVDYLLIETLPTVGVPAATATGTESPAITPLPPSTTLMPAATPTATSTPQPTATATPIPLPPIRLQIPAIGLNSRVETLDAQVTQQGPKRERWLWPDPGYVVGHYSFSGRPTEKRNIVLTGHNNWKGAIFRNLPRLQTGDMITLSTADNSYRYAVTESVIIPYRDDPVRGDRELWRYFTQQGGEQLTLFSCYPFATNADRIVVIAKPVDQE